MSLLDRAEELKDIPDAQLAQLVKQGSEAGDTWLAATETQRRKDMRARYAAEAAKQQAANPPSVLEQRAAELGGGIPNVDPNTQGPDPSLQTGIATAAGGGLIRGYQQGGEIGGDPELERAMSGATSRRQEEEDVALAQYPIGSQERTTLAHTTEMLQQDIDRLDSARGPGRRRPDPMLVRRRARLKDQLKILSLLETGDQRIPTPPVGGGGRPLVDEGFLSPAELQVTEETPIVRDTPFFPGAGSSLPAYLQSPQGVPEGGVDVSEAADDDLALLESLRIGGDSGSGLPTLAETYAEGRGHIRDYQDLMGESDEDLAYDQLRREATAKALQQAGGIRSLEQEGIKEEELLLAKRLGISEDRMAELMREMDTPEEVESRRRGAAFGGMSRMFLNPDLATGIGGMSDELTDLDEILRSERKTALGDIFDERVAGADLETLKRKGIFDSTIQSQKDWDEADLAMQNMESTIAKERAARGRAGQEEAMKSFIDLLKNQAQHIGAWNSTMAQITAQMQEATVNRDNPMMQAEAWEKIEMGLDDWVNRIKDKDGPEYKMYLRAVEVKDAAFGTLLIRSGESIMRADQGAGVPASRRTEAYAMPYSPPDLLD